MILHQSTATVANHKVPVVSIPGSAAITIAGSSHVGRTHPILPPTSRTIRRHHLLPVSVEAQWFIIRMTFDSLLQRFDGTILAGSYSEVYYPTTSSPIGTIYTLFILRACTETYLTFQCGRIRVAEDLSCESNVSERTILSFTKMSPLSKSIVVV